MTQSLPDAGAPALATELDTSPRPLERSADSAAAWQPGMLWRATTSGIALVEVRQRLEPLLDRFIPTGDLDSGVVTYHPAKADPQRHRFHAAPASCHRGVGDPIGRSADLVAHLPELVVAALDRVETGSAYEHIVFARYPDEHRRPYREKLRLLRLGSRRAVVVVADRQAARFAIGTNAEQASENLARLSWWTTVHIYEVGVGYRI